MSIDFEKLRAANITRQAEWPGNERADLAFRAIEVADEAGELLGAIKKLLRAERGIAGTTLSLQDVADEMGDTVISLDLLAIELGFDLGAPAGDFISVQPILSQALMLDAVVGDLSEAVVELLVVRTMIKQEEVEEAQRVFESLHRAIFWIMCLGRALGLGLETAVTGKFNKTSEKYGMATRM